MMTDAELRADDYKLEPRAMNNAWKAGDRPSETEIELSRSISAKRQADALERIAESLRIIQEEGFHPEWGIAPTMRQRMQG